MLRRLPSLWGQAPAATTKSSDADACQSPDGLGLGLHPVYVGQSRRRYLITAELAEHPLLQVLLRHSAKGDGGSAVVGCEVLLFEHLLWMLENGEDENESVDELVEYYAC